MEASGDNGGTPFSSGVCSIFLNMMRLCSFPRFLAISPRMCYFGYMEERGSEKYLDLMGDAAEKMSQCAKRGDSASADAYRKLFVSYKEMYEDAKNREAQEQLEDAFGVSEIRVTFVCLGDEDYARVHRLDDEIAREIEDAGASDKRA